MGWFSTAYMQLEVLMHFDPPRGQGIGAARWVSLERHPQLSKTQASIAITSLLYARTLVNHAETRAELFHRVAGAAIALEQQTGPLSFPDWFLAAGGSTMQLWPWVITEPQQVPHPKIYVATLDASRRGSLGIYLKMAWGLERVLAPAAPLIALTVLARTLDEQDVHRLAGVLLAVNQYYGRPEASARIGSETKAFQAALPVLLA